MKRLIQEPLVHFLALGALLFAGYAALNRNGTQAHGRIVVSQGQLASMLESFARTRQRSPTPEEWDGLIRARVREEVYYREALALGLDKDDTIIRRRLQQKMEFVSDDVAAQAQPTEADLNAYLQARPDKFRLEPQFSFRHLYLNPVKHGANLARDGSQLLEKLNEAGGDTGSAAKGDPFMLGSSFRALPASELANQFGRGFAMKLGGLEPGRWQGPVESAFGLHVVLVTERKDGRVPALTEVRDAVRREWDDAQRQQARDRFYQELLKHYTITIEQPAAEKEKKLAEAR